MLDIFLNQFRGWGWPGLKDMGLDISSFFWMLPIFNPLDDIHDTYFKILGCGSLDPIMILGLHNGPTAQFLRN